MLHLNPPLEEIEAATTAGGELTLWLGEDNIFSGESKLSLEERRGIIKRLVLLWNSTRYLSEDDLRRSLDT